MLREHLAALSLVDYKDVTTRAVSSGAWSDPNVWQDGMTPSEGDNVLIPRGQVVTVDTVLDASLRTVRVDGTLRFEPDSGYTAGRRHARRDARRADWKSARRIGPSPRTSAPESLSLTMGR